MSQTVEISKRTRIWFLLAAWFIAALATAIPDPEVLLFPYLFPTGLFEFIPDKLVLLNAPDSGYVCLFGAYVVYIGLSIVLLLQNRKMWYFVLYAMLCAILALNVVGCHTQINRSLPI